MAAYGAIERTADKDRHPLGEDHDVVGDVGHIEGEHRPALVQRAEQDGGCDDAERVASSHQRYRDAGETGARGHIEGEPMLRAEQLVDRDQPGKTPAAADRDDQGPPNADASGA
jgi:hypothetical protein